MQQQPTTHGFEKLPEFITTRTYVRCLDRLFQSLPPSEQWQLIEPVFAAAVRIGSGIACLRGDPEPPRRFSTAEREEGRMRVLEGLWLSREWLDEIARVPGVDRAELLVAYELLDRIEGSVRVPVLPR